MWNRLIKPGKSIASLLLLTLILPHSGISVAQSIELDKKLGAENAKIVEAQMGLVPDEELTDYVRGIGNRLIAELDNNPFEFQFHIADDPIPNAFALPGGYVYVTRGILSLITTEDELACVMGHEIIHVIRRHSVRQMRSSILPHMLELPGAIVGTVVNEDLGNLLNTPITTSNSLLLASYSRKHETESDTRGIELASKAGYDPNAMATILERLSLAVEVITNEKEKKSYFDDHPYTPDRVNKINKTSSKLSWEEKTKISEDFPAPLDGMVFGNNPAKGLFNKEVFLHPELNFTITFPAGWETSNQPYTVSAIHENRQAGIFVGLEDPARSPEEYGKMFEQEIVKKHGQQPSRSEPRTLNNHPGYLITMADNSGDEPMYIHILWLKMGGKVFKLIGIAPKALEPDLQKSARSLRPLTPTERNAIEVYRLRIVRANKKESLEELNKRTGNVVNTNATSIMNGLGEKPKLDKNQALKIVVREKYFR
ncbi:MAG: M48 family metalloprotease [Bacteroidetes bacterium]|nr:M48 family metalloprotease [Bacteroidota bacterium]